MSGGRRKPNSKWDLKEDSQLSHEKLRDSAWPGKAGLSYHEKESRPGRFSPKAASYSNVNKWSGREADDILSSKHDLPPSYRESLLRSRGSRRDDSIDDYRDNFKATTTWDEDGSYSVGMSPVDEWRHQIRRRSPKNDWNRHRRSRSRSKSRSRSRSRSWNRSRSPGRGFRREPDLYGRNRGRLGVSAPLCKDFTAGRCRRGSHCHFSHHSSHSYEDSWESRHRETGAAKYSTPHESREYPVRSGRYREGSLERRGEHHESLKSGDIPCKFFAAGNCRNGKYCRFSHGSQALASPNRRSRDDNLVRAHNSDNMDKLWNGPKWDDANTFSDDAKLSEEKNERMGANRKSLDGSLVRNHNSDNVEKLWDGPTWSGMDTFADAAKLSDNPNDRMGTPGSRFIAWSGDDRLLHGLDENAAHAKRAAVSNEGGESNKMETLRCKITNAGEGGGASESGGMENWLGDMEMSPDWNYTVKSSNCAINDDHGHILRSSHSLPISDASLLREQGITREASVVLHDPVTTMQPIIMDKLYLKQDISQRDSGGTALPCGDKNAIGKTAISPIDLNFSSNILPTERFDQSAQSSNALSFSNLNSIGQSQSVIASEPSRGGNLNNHQNHALFQVEKSSNKPGIGDGSASQFSSGIQTTQNVVSSAQLTQLTNLSASLVQYLGNGQQLPQLYAALDTHNVMQVPSSANSEGPIAPDSAVINQLNEAIRSQKQYDPLCDSIDSKKHDAVNAPGSSINPAEQKVNADGKPNGDSQKIIDKSQVPKQLESEANRKVSEISGGAEAVEDTKKQVENNTSEKNGKVKKTDEDDKDDKAEKSKDTKGIRAFKFALAEFAKELLKPAWKEGQINKDAYKNIVKKVVDKVIGAMQGAANIPQTQDKIDQYLSFSKPKLSKLVQAYVEKFRKG